MSDVAERLTEYLVHGGFYNPELMAHDKVRDLLIDCRDEIVRLREYALADARCACCETTDRCQDDCTFALDCPVEAARMVAARTALGEVTQ